MWCKFGNVDTPESGLNETLVCLVRAVHLKHAGPFETQSKVVLEDSSPIGDEFPQYGSQNGVTAPRTGGDDPQRDFCGTFQRQGSSF